VLATRAPELTEALERVKDEGWAYVILDGTVVQGPPHGGNLQAVIRPDSLPIWLSPVGKAARPDRRLRVVKDQLGLIQVSGQHFDRVGRFRDSLLDHQPGRLVGGEQLAHGSLAHVVVSPGGGAVTPIA
jgi:hypothetical protein